MAVHCNESAKCAMLRAKALDGFRALCDSIGQLADGSEEPGDILDDAIRSSYAPVLDALLEVRFQIEDPVICKHTNADFQDSIDELGSPRDVIHFLAKMPHLDIGRFERGMLALDEFIQDDSDDSDGDEDSM